MSESATQKPAAVKIEYQACPLLLTGLNLIQKGLVGTEAEKVDVFALYEEMEHSSREETITVFRYFKEQNLDLVLENLINNLTSAQDRMATKPSSITLKFEGYVAEPALMILILAAKLEFAALDRVRHTEPHYIKKIWIIERLLKHFAAELNSREANPIYVTRGIIMQAQLKLWWWGFWALMSLLLIFSILQSGPGLVTILGVVLGISLLLFCVDRVRRTDAMLKILKELWDAAKWEEEEERKNLKQKQQAEIKALKQKQRAELHNLKRPASQRVQEILETSNREAEERGTHPRPPGNK